MDSLIMQSMALIIVLLVVFIFWVWYMTMNHTKLQSIKFKDSQFKTGDMILFHAYDNINPVFIGSYWGHVGVVYKDPDDINSKPIIFEAASTSKMKNCPEYNKHGIMITDLKTRVEKYPGRIACKSLNNPVSDDVIRGFKELMNYAKNNMHYNDDVVYNAIQKKKGEKFNIGTNCGELVVLSLIKLALLPESTSDENIAHHLLYVAHLEQLQNNCYNTPVEITINPF
jgi:hypothetical protein